MQVGDGERHAKTRNRAGQSEGEATLLERLVELAKRIRERLAERCEAEGVSDSRFAVLRAVAGVNAEGCSQTELAAQLGLSESNVCSLVERMRSGGLLYRFRCKKDRRKSVLLLTERGRELVDAVSRAQEIETESLLSVLDGAQQRELWHLLERLHRHLDAASQLAVPSAEIAGRNRGGESPVSPAGTTSEPAQVSRRAS